MEEEALRARSTWIVLGTVSVACVATTLLLSDQFEHQRMARHMAAFSALPERERVLFSYFFNCDEWLEGKLGSSKTPISFVEIQVACPPPHQIADLRLSLCSSGSAYALIAADAEGRALYMWHEQHFYRVGADASVPVTYREAVGVREKASLVFPPK